MIPFPYIIGGGKPPPAGWDVKKFNGIPGVGPGGSGFVTLPIFEVCSVIQDVQNPNPPPKSLHLTDPGSCGQVLGKPGASTGNRYFELQAQYPLESGPLGGNRIALGISPILPAPYIDQFAGMNLGVIPGAGTMFGAEGNIYNGDGPNYQSYNGFAGDLGHTLVRFAVSFSQQKIWVGIAIDVFGFYTSPSWLNGVPGVSGGTPLQAPGAYYPAAAIWYKDVSVSVANFLQASTFKIGPVDAPGFTAWAPG